MQASTQRPTGKTGHPNVRPEVMMLRMCYAKCQATQSVYTTRSIPRLFILKLRLFRLQSAITSSNLYRFLGCIECMRCRLLLPMCAASVCQPASPPVCLSRGSTRLHCAGIIRCSLYQITLASCQKWNDGDHNTTAMVQGWS